MKGKRGVVNEKGWGGRSCYAEGGLIVGLRGRERQEKVDEKKGKEGEGLSMRSEWRWKESL